MLAGILSINFIITLALSLSIIMNIMIAFIMGYKLHLNHMKYHVFRPMLAGILFFVISNALVSLFIAFVLQTSYVGGIIPLLIVSIFILFGSIVLFVSMMYSAKHIFEKLEVPEILEEKESE